MAADGESLKSEYQPALDGIRGAAVLAVLVFHGRFEWAKGGFLGVSTFFTLSGFLITRLILTEFERTETVDLKAFWGRRIRRLAPALGVAVVAVAVLARFVIRGEEPVGLRQDMAATLGQVSNWWFITEGRSYSELFSSPSLLQHAWSLSIEAQLYLIVPPLLVLALKRGLNRRRIAALVGVVMAWSLVLTRWFDWPNQADRMYFGTDIRAFEVLAGVLLALIWPKEIPEVWKRRLGYVGLAAGAATLAAWTLVPGSSSHLLYQGGLGAYALVSVGLIAGASVPGRLRDLLAHKSLAWVGQISYGLYLFHWPIFVWLSPPRLDIGQVSGFALATGLTFAVAVLSYRLVEEPVRRKIGLGSWNGVVAYRAASLAGVVVLLAVGVVTPTGNDVLQGNAKKLDDALDQAGPVKPGAPKIAFFGDSTALALAVGTAQWSIRTGSVDMVKGSTALGCGLAPAGKRRHLGETGEILPQCQGQISDYQVKAKDLDLAIYVGGAWDVADQSLPGTKGDLISIEDPELYVALKKEAEQVVTALSAGGALVVWVLVPHLEKGVVDGISPAKPWADSDPKRIDRYNQMGRELELQHPNSVVTIDLGAWFRRQPGGEMSRDLRSDGTHLSEGEADRAATEFFGPQLLLASRR